jgi:hypothetical protein
MTLHLKATTSETHPHAAAATRRTYRWPLEPILPLIERCKNFREAWFALIVKGAARLIGALVEFARFPVRQLKGGVMLVLVVRLREMIVLVLPIGWGADKSLHPLAAAAVNRHRNSAA